MRYRLEWWVYVLRCQSTGRYYVGSAQYVDVRLHDHNRGHVASTKPYGPWSAVYREPQPNRSSAYSREREIKSKKGRRWIEYNLLLNGD